VQLCGGARGRGWIESLRRDEVEVRVRVKAENEEGAAEGEWAAGDFVRVVLDVTNRLGKSLPA
jgi:hypothetical protein